VIGEVDIMILVYGGNAGCIGCVCVSPTINIPLGKGSAYTSPADGVPQGDTLILILLCMK
jgi:hypothetical protein